MQTQSQLIDRIEIESLLRCYKFQKYTIAGWKEVPKAILGGSSGIASTFRTHLLAGLILYSPSVTTRPQRYLAHLFSDLLVLLSQIVEAGDGSNSPGRTAPAGTEEDAAAGRVMTRRRNSLAPPRILREKKRVLQRNASEATMSLASKAVKKKGMMFRIEKVFPFTKAKVELQLANCGFAVDGQELTVDGNREVLFRWYAALRKCEIGELIDVDARRTPTPEPTALGSSGGGGGSDVDDEYTAMLDEFGAYDTAVIRDNNDDGSASDESKFLAQKVFKAGGEVPKSQGTASIKMRNMFVPPPDVIPLRIRPRTGSVMREGEEESEQQPQQMPKSKSGSSEPLVDSVEDLAKMLASAQYTLRLLRAGGVEEEGE